MSRTNADRELTRYNRAVFALPQAERERYIDNGRVIVPEDPREALQELLRTTSITEADIQTPRIQEPARPPRQPTNTMEDFWHMQGWVKTNKYGETTLEQGAWHDDVDVQVDAIRFLVEKVLGKNPRDVTNGDFRSNKLGGLLCSYYNNSPYVAISDAYPELDIKPWEMTMTPQGFYREKENRVTATKWLVEMLGKNPSDMTKEDFNSNRLGGLLSYYYNDSPYAAVREAYPEQVIKPWEMTVTPNGFYDRETVRVEAVRWLIEKLGKDLRDMTKEDFNSNRLGGLLNHYYNGSPYAAVREAYPEQVIKPWEMTVTPMGFYEGMENRIAATKWLVERLGKNPSDMTKEDFNSNRLGGLLSYYYNDSPYAALLEAGLVTPADEEHMHSRGMRILAEEYRGVLRA